jgi:Ca2+-binding EF-hand superfamily protein
MDRLADRFAEEVGEQEEKEARKRSSGLARRGMREPPSADLQRPDLHPDLLGTLNAEAEVTERKSSKDSRVSQRSSKDARVSIERKGSKDSRGSISEGNPPRERRNIHEVLSKNPQLKADVDRLKYNRLSEKRSLNPARPEDRAVLDDLFLCYDPNGDGTGSLSYKEFSRLVKELGLALSKGEVEGMMKQLDANGNGLIEIDEFALFFNHAGTRDGMKANAGDSGGSKNTFVRKLFDEFGDPSGKGVNLDGLNLALKACCLDKGENKVTPDEVKLFFQRLDVDNTGFLGIEKLKFLIDNIQARDQLKEGIQILGMRNTDVLKQVHEKFDSSLKGGMNKFDLLAAVQFLGFDIKQSSVDALLAKVDADNNGTVEFDEFIDFFEQMQNTEELVEELDKFKRAQARQKYVHGLVFMIALACVIGGLYATVYISDPVMRVYGLAFMFIGAVILLLMILPDAASALYGLFFHECIATFNPTKAILINLGLTLHT